MSKQVKCFRQTTILGVATQWACAEHLYSAGCVVSQLQNHHYSSARTRGTILHAWPRIGIGGGIHSLAEWEQLAVMGWGTISAVQLATDSSVSTTHEKEIGEYHLDITSSILKIYSSYTVPHNPKKRIGVNSLHSINPKQKWKLQFICK